MLRRWAVYGTKVTRFARKYEGSPHFLKILIHKSYFTMRGRRSSRNVSRNTITASLASLKNLGKPFFLAVVKMISFNQIYYSAEGYKSHKT